MFRGGGGVNASRMRNKNDLFSRDKTFVVKLLRAVELCKFLVIQTFKNLLLVSLDCLSLASLATQNKNLTAGEKTERKTCKKKLQKKSIQSESSGLSLSILAHIV